MRAGLLALIALGCANVLGYDDYRARTSDATTGVEATVDSNTSVDDTFEAGSGGVRPPPRPTGIASPSGKGKTIWLIVNHFYLNQDEFLDSGMDKPWKYIGYDLDGICTGERESRENTGTCKRVMGAEQDVLIDGLLCRDNNFGSQLVPIVTSLDARYEKTSNEAIAKGSSTWILKLEDLDDGPDDPYVVGKLYKAAPWPDFFGPTSPPFDGTEDRDVDVESVNENDIEKPKTLFMRGYLNGNVFVSGDPSKFSVTIPIQSVSVDAPLAGGILTLKLDPEHTKGELGVLAGALPNESIPTVLQPIAEQAGVCPGATLYDNFIRGIGRMMDLVADSPTLNDTTQTCNGLSLGLAFTAVPLKPPTKVTPGFPRESKCAKMDAGTGG
jgi:hypothetical protein